MHGLSSKKVLVHFFPVDNPAAGICLCCKDSAFSVYFFIVDNPVKGFCPQVLLRRSLKRFSSTLDNF